MSGISSRVGTFLSIASVVLGVAACGSGGGGGGGGGDEVNVTIATASGGHMSPEGAWANCYTDNSGTPIDKKEVQTFTGASLVIANYTYASADGSCTGGETPDGGAITLPITGTADTTIIGWLTNAGDTVAPPNDGVTDDETVTVLTLDGTSIGEGSNVKEVRLIDDNGGTSTPSHSLQMWRGENDSTNCPQQSDTDQCLGNFDPLIKQ